MNTVVGLTLPVITNEEILEPLNIVLWKYHFHICGVKEQMDL